MPGCLERSDAWSARMPGSQKLRCCKMCQTFLPLDRFRPKGKRNLCSQHHSEVSRRQRNGIPAKKAALSVWARCLKDLDAFGQYKLPVTLEQIETLLGDRVRDYAQLYLLPVSPLAPVSVSNAMPVSRDQRKLLISAWKGAEYRRVQAAVHLA